MTGSSLRPVLIAGPTASGKSALALRLAERDGGCVINADALQVYSCWRILTARPDDEDCARALHRLYGHVDCGFGYSVGHWLRDVAAALDAARAAGQRPIVVGGAGLYFAALLEGLADIPPVPRDVRRRSEALLREGGLGRMLDDLARGDPETWARIDRSNPMRAQRAWDVWTATGRGLVAWRRTQPEPLLRAQDTLRLLVAPHKQLLNENIEMRFSAMIGRGALAECAAFMAAGGDLAAPSGRALGAAELVAHLEGRMSLAQATAAAVTATRRYAKRQRTWFRSRMRDWTILGPAAGDPLRAVPPD